VIGVLRRSNKVPPGWASGSPPRAARAGPVPPANPREKSAMSTVEERLESLEKDNFISKHMARPVQQTGTIWASYFHAMSAAYSAAYARQERLLSQTKGAIDAARKEAEENRVFILSLVTAGVAGLAANKIAKLGVDSGNELTKEGAKKMVETATKVVKQAAGKGAADWVSEKLRIKEDPLEGSRFTPSGLSPGDYAGRLLSGLASHMAWLNAWVERYELAEVPQGVQAVLDHARAVMLQMDFFAKAPKRPFAGTEGEQAEKQAKLQDRAELALWISWALERDKKHWIKDGAIRLYNPGASENRHYEPIRKELIRLGVPKQVVSLKPVADFIPIGHFARIDEGAGLNLVKFMDWAATHGALKLVFQGLPVDGEGMQWVQARWTKSLPKAK
jgi:hypothetical protein